MSVQLFPLEAGVHGLRSDLLHLLVQHRYACAMTTGTAWANRTFEQLHESMNHAVATSPELTREALLALERMGLVERVPAGSDSWCATTAGVIAVDRTHAELEEPEYRFAA